MASSNLTTTAAERSGAEAVVELLAMYCSASGVAHAIVSIVDQAAQVAELAAMANAIKASGGTPFKFESYPARLGAQATRMWQMVD